ncbi:WSC-domain-containing protein [Lophiostoma macrostomum CBS 122681]|uniref:WSC-domain-containing protein n=1 Tax=Lophiostoma macrostomum CBS 122681 TaxID=1314788 RepID=A0A6A6SVQ0_9PLEO|nr:WSC-domain-containing protein [Lophiostoma macrostomum CBS 122681]
MTLLPVGMLSPKKLSVAICSLLFSARIYALGATDTITWGGDNTRAGYQTNHNMDPAVVGSSNFGQIFRTQLPGNFQNLAAEQIFSQPLVYTGSDGIQYVYVATSQNNIYKLDAKTGAIVKSRNLHVPFLQADLENCVDINPLIGVTATGVIDPDTGIWYLTSKTYAETFQDGNFSPNNPPGRLNGRYWQHAVHTEDLSEANNWPVLVDGTIFRNNPNRMFLGGNQHSRPGALLVGDYLYTGYASHCIQYNYTGAIIGYHKTTGQVVEAFATEGGPEPNTIKGGGIWMSGGGLAYDGKGSMYFATGNGYASQLKTSGNPVPGRSPPSSLEEAAVNAKINDDGTLTIIDFFMPWEKTQLDGADKDLGTSPLELLPSTFTCPNNRRIGVVTGKSGKTYWLDLDNLGGYQMGPNNLDAVIQVFQNENSVYAGAGVMPLGGGYIYINVIQYATHVFKFSCNDAGYAVFTKVTDTPDTNAYILGVGHGTTTSLNDQEGTGLLWIADVEGQNLRIYDPIPPSDGSPLTRLNAFNIPGVTKFTRPVFGDGTVYIGTTQGYLYGFGSPVNSPLNCSSPYSFGTVQKGNISDPLTITCVALVGTTIENVNLTGNTNFNVSSAPTLPLNLAVGASFSFQAVSAPQQVGSLSSDVVITTSNSQSGYSTNTPVTLKVSAHSAKPLLAISPNTVSFSVVVGQPSDAQNTLLWNFGDSLLTFQNISFSLTSETGPWVTPNTTSSGQLQVGNFLFNAFPATINATSYVGVPIAYAPDVAGTHSVFVKAFSDGGNAVLDVLGKAGTFPKSVIEFQTVDGSGWVPYVSGIPFSFGTVYESQTRNLLFRITNGGGVNAVPLSITVSKPPYGVPGIIGKANNIDLAEGTSIFADQSATAMMYCAVPETQVNQPSYNGTTTWTINTGDPDQGKQFIEFVCYAGIPQVGPLLPNGTAQYGYVGCFEENNPGRQLAANVYNDATNNTNDECIAACYAANYTFAGTQYYRECWCGNAIPIQLDLERDCNFPCTGNSSQICGGDGTFHNTSQISLFADSTKFDGNTTSPPLQITPSVGIYNFLNCYAETAGKTLSDQSTTSTVMTVEACASFCSAYMYFGLEYAAECYCGAKLNAQSTVVDPSQCNMPCKGSNSEYCGAGSRMQVYQANGPLPSSSSSSAPVSSSSSSSSSVAVTASTSTSSSVVSSSSIITSASTVSSSASVPTTSASTTSGSVPSPSVSGYAYQGCYNEIPNGRALSDKSELAQPVLTLELCASFCAGFAFFGVEYAGECYCGNTLQAASSKQADETGCSMACSGNAAESCGGPNFLNVYFNSAAITSSSTTSSASSVPTSGPTAPAVIGSYTSLGCYTELNNARALKAQSFANSSMTLELCSAFCSGYTYFGAEYASECYCDNSLPSASLPATDGRCNMPCANNASEICGGPNGLNVYQLSPVSTSSSTVSTSTSTSPSSISVSVSTSTSSSASPTASIKPAAICPTTDNTTYTSPNGVVYTRECYIDRVNNDITSQYVASFDACLALCDTTPQCLVVSWVASTGGNSPCYLKFAAGTPVADGRIYGAVKATGSSSSGVVSGTSVSSTSIFSTSSVSPSSVTPSATPSSSTTALSTSTSSSTQIPSPATSSSSSSAVLTSLSSSSSSSTPPTPTSSTPPSVSGYTYTGCYSDASSSRALSALPALADGSNMTPTLCASYCSQYAYFGLEYARECWCGAYLTSFSSLVPNQADCNMPCSGSGSDSSSTICGGPNRLSVYHSADPSKVSTDPDIAGNGAVGNYTYLYCVVDSGAPRVLPFLNASDGMSTESCLATAEQMGLAYAGVEYGRECYGGNEVMGEGVNMRAGEADCGMSCLGARGELCGGSSRLGLWVRNGTAA